MGGRVHSMGIHVYTHGTGNLQQHLRNTFGYNIVSISMLGSAFRQHPDKDRCRGDYPRGSRFHRLMVSRFLFELLFDCSEGCMLRPCTQEGHMAATAARS